MILSKSKALAKDKWITVTKHSRLAKPEPHNCQGPFTTNRYAILAESPPTVTTQHHQACPVFDNDSGRTLEHRQLRKDPKYKETWDRSYVNDLGRLC